FLLLFRQTLDDRLLPPGVFRAFELEVHSRQQHMRRTVIRQLSDDAFKQADGLLRPALTLNQLRELEQHAGVIRPEFECASQERGGLLRLPIFTEQPAEPGIRHEVTRVDLQFGPEFLNRLFAVDTQQVYDAELCMQRGQIRIDPHRLLEFIRRGLNLPASQVEGAKDQMCFGRIEIPENLIHQRLTFGDLVVLNIGIGEGISGGDVVRLRAVNRLKFRGGLLQSADLKEAQTIEESGLEIAGHRFCDSGQFNLCEIKLIYLEVCNPEVEANAMFGRVNRECGLVAFDRGFVLPQSGVNHPEIRERIRPARDQLQRAFVSLTRALQITLLL